MKDSEGGRQLGRSLLGRGVQIGINIAREIKHGISYPKWDFWHKFWCMFNITAQTKHIWSYSD